MIATLVPLLLIPASSQGAGVQDSTGRVTVATGLLPASKALAELSKATGLALRAAPATADLPLMIRVNGAETRIVLGKIAETLGAEWRTDGAGYLLTSDSAFRKRLARTPDARRIARFEASLVAAQAETKDLRFDEAFATRTRKEGERMMASVMSSVTDGGKEVNPMSLLRSPAFTQTPASQAINGLLASIGAANLAGLPRGERVVYALTPTAMQIALPSGSRATLERFAASTAAYAQAMKNTSDGEETDMFSMISGGPVTGQGPIADAHLELWPANGMISARLVLFDAAGKSLGTGFSFLDATSPMPVVPPGGVPLVVTELGREWGAKLAAASQGIIDPRDGLGAMNGMFGGPSRAALGRPTSPALRAWIKDPVENSLAGPLFEPIATAVPGDLIATIPDAGLALLGGLVSAKEITGASALAAIEASPDFSVVHDGTWTVIGAATPSRLREGFADRRALRTLVGAIARTGFLRLDDAAQYALAQREEAGARYLGAPIVTILQGQSAFAYGTDPLVSEFETLRVYGSLSAAQRAALLAGQNVPYSALSPEASDAIGRILFDSPTGPMPSFEDAAVGEDEVEDADTERDGVAELLMGEWGTRRAERTVRFATGVPRAGYLTMTSGTNDTYRMVDSSTGATTFGGPEVLGFLRGAKDLPMFRAIVPPSNYDRFTPAQERFLSFQFVFAPKLASSATLQDHEVRSTESLTYDQLPEEFRAGVEEAAKAAAMMKQPPARVKP